MIAYLISKVNDEMKFIFKRVVEYGNGKETAMRQLTHVGGRGWETQVQALSRADEEGNGAFGGAVCGAGGQGVENRDARRGSD